MTIQSIHVQDGGATGEQGSIPSLQLLLWADQHTTLYILGFPDMFAALPSALAIFIVRHIGVLCPYDLCALSICCLPTLGMFPQTSA